MAYYKYVDNGYIFAIGNGGMGVEITDNEYNTILSVIQNKPKGTDVIDYRLREDLVWKPCVKVE